MYNVYKFIDRPDLPKVTLPNGSCFVRVEKVLLGQAKSYADANREFVPPPGTGYLYELAE